MAELAQAHRPSRAQAAVQRHAAAPDSVAQRMNAGPDALQLKSLSDRMNAAQRAPAPNATGLPDGLKSGIEGLSGLSLDKVRVNYNSARPAQMQAHAFTQGTDIHVAPGQERHLPHEAWHVVQQAQGRVRPTLQLMAGTPVNDDPGLEREADVMGARALSGAPAQRMAAVAEPPAQTAVQMAAPGGIEHAMNSCFVAALINTFTVVRPLRNLLIPDNNVIAGGPAKMLQDLLWRAVNTVDASVLLSRGWVMLIMASLKANGIVGNAVASADFPNIMANTVAALRGHGAGDGQTNDAPVTTGEVPWSMDETLQDTVANHIGAALGINPRHFHRTPNTVQVTRNIFNTQIAPRAFNLYPGGFTVSYRLRSIVERDAGYVGGHFTSNIDRGGDGAPEWWHSDDVDPHGVAPIAPPDGAGLLKTGLAYVYERADAVLAPDAVASREGAIDGAAHLQESYDGDLARYVAEEEGYILDDEEEPPEVDSEKVESGAYDKDLQKAPQEAETALKSAIKVFLPPIATSGVLAGEMQRQLQLQLASLNALSVKEWALQAMLNRLKSPDQLVEGYHTGAGEAVAGRVDLILRNNDHLARELLGLIAARMTETRRAFDPRTESRAIALIGRIVHLAGQAAHADESWKAFSTAGGLAALANLSTLGIKGGLGRQYGRGDNTWFRKEHEPGVALFEHGKLEQQAVLHNPDQVAGGNMEIFHGDKEENLLAQAKANFIRARDTFHAQDRSLWRAKDQTDAKAKLGQAKQSFEEARDVYRDLIGRYLGDSAVNSALGRGWIEVLPDDTSRIGALLDYAMSVPYEQWDEAKMAVGMRADVSGASKLAPKPVKPSTLEKKEEKHATANAPSKRKRKSGSGRKKKSRDAKVDKFAGKKRQTSLLDMFSFASKPKPDLDEEAVLEPPSKRIKRLHQIDLTGDDEEEEAPSQDQEEPQVQAVDEDSENDGSDEEDHEIIELSD